MPLRRMMRRRPRVPRRRKGYRRVGGRYRTKIVRTFNPQPTFVETYFDGHQTFSLPAGTSQGLKFAVKITDVPQVTQYANLYKQYRINWVKVMLLPKLTTDGIDPNTATQNALSVPPQQWFGSARLAYAIQDSPGVAVPATEQEVLECNGSKIKLFRSKWSCSFKPVPDIAVQNAGGVPVYTRQKFREWFNFDTTGAGGNPSFGSVIAWLSLPGNANPPADPFLQTYYVYYKVNFSLRDPQ